MSYPLYNLNGNYYLTIDHGVSFNYMIDFRNYSTRMINKDDVTSALNLDLNHENLTRVLKDLNKLSLVDISSFDDSYSYNRILYYKDKPFYVNNWRDVLNTISN